MKNNQKIIDAVAEAWVSFADQYTKNAYRNEKNSKMSCNDPFFTGHYDGYQSEADELVNRIRMRGFEIVPRSKLRVFLSKLF